MHALATGLKSFPFVLAVAACFALGVGAVLPGSPGRAQEANPAIAPRFTEEALIARGNELLEAGDFASARLLYQAAASQGSGTGAMLTGVTFDPRYQEMAGVSGTPSDVELARQWYALAMERGDEQAQRNDLELTEWLKGQNVDPEADSPPEHQAAASVETPQPTPLDQAKSEPPNMAPEPESSAEPAVQAEIATSIEPSNEPYTAASAFDARVVRAQLTSAINDREPVDRLPSSIRVSDGGIGKVLFFSEVRDLAGQRLSHRWEREGNVMADISFSVGGNTWRMHSSKRVTPAMAGNWRVVVADAGGAELASVPFTLE
jgi:hypothetical protein